MMFLGYIVFVLVSIGYVHCDLDEVPDVLAGDAADCSCGYHRGGCVITVSAPIGFKCQCKYLGAWTCAGTAYPCVGKEKCPGNLADYCACKLGEGECGGYREPLGTCEDSGLARIGVEGKADCECQYHPGGCTIYKPAPYGWRCVCTYKGFWTCAGWAQQCAVNEVCLGDDFSYCGCKNGGGGCGGYPDKPYCPSPFLSRTCDCDRSSDWNRGLYTIDGVDFITANKQIHSLQPITLAEKDIPNFSGSTQTISLTVGEKLTQTSSFSHTSGIEIEAGIGFVAGYPLVGGVGGHVSVTGSYSYTWGQSESIETMFQGKFTCNGAPHKYTQCLVTMKKARVSVPYVMHVKHKVIPNCVCDSYGVWSGAQAYNAKLLSNDVGDCYKSECTKTVDLY